jgi:hypothetical protein
MNSKRLIRGRTLLTMSLALAALSCPGPTPIAPPDTGEETELTAKLQQQGMIVPLQAPEVLGFVFELPEGPSDTGEASLDLQPGAGLPRAGLLDNTKDSLERPGMYLAVQDAGELFVHLVRLNDVRTIRAEAEASSGKMQPAFVTFDGGVISARVPFAPGGWLKVFDIGSNDSVDRVRIVVPLGPAPFPPEGMLLEVPCS